MNVEGSTIREYCFRCDKVQLLHESRFSGGWRWLCSRCGATVDVDFGDDKPPAPEKAQ